MERKICPQKFENFTLMFTFIRHTPVSEEDTSQLINIWRWHREGMYRMKDDDVYVRKC
jgi:hypothetical protein